MKGILDSRVAVCDIRAKSIASWTFFEQSMAKPVARATMTSEWSPKIDKPWQARERAVMWKTVGVSSPAILYMLGIISKSPCEAEIVVAKAPVVKEPCTAPATPASDCISLTFGTEPHIFTCPAAVLASHISAMGEDGVMG